MEPREQRGLMMAAVMKIVPKGGIWLVPSETKSGERYAVNLVHGTCTCPDHVENGNKCKHMFAVEFVLRREGLKNGGTTDLNGFTGPERKPTYRQNWPAYNLAQTTEKHRFRVLLYDLTRRLANPPSKPGRPRVPLSDAVFAAVYKVYSTVSTRRFMCDLKDAYEQGLVSRPIHYNSICAYLEWEHLTSVLHQTIERSSMPLKAVETKFAADSTGFSTSRFVRWFDEKYGVTRPGHDWVKVHIMTGVTTNVVTAIEIRGRGAGDAPLFGPLLKATARNFKVEEVAADKGYLSERNIEAVFEAGGTPFVPFKPNSSDAKGGLWEKMLLYYQLRREDFLKHYHQRSNVESTFSMIKAKFRDHVRSRSDTAMRNEVLCKVLCHNICCVIHSQCELGIEPEFWPPSDKPQQAG